MIGDSFGVFQRLEDVGPRIKPLTLVKISHAPRFAMLDRSSAVCYARPQTWSGGTHKWR